MPERFLGRQLGKYRVDALIGSGGFAWVYKAYDPQLEIPVALKVLKPHYAGDEQFEQRFRREASMAAKLRHPNIIKIFDVGRDGEAVYFAMDYLPQGLADRLAVMTTLPEPMLIRVAIDVASALGFAHREGVIHRDIKTDNILFDDHGNAIVADFGIARAVSDYVNQTGTNMVVGTPQYFSPEQARGLPLDGRADLYSLGVTLYKSATGVLPFAGTDWYEIARQHVEDAPPRPRTVNAALSPDLEAVILRCLEKSVDDRYPTGEALCEDLVQLLAERGETAAYRTSVVPALSADGSLASPPRKRFTVPSRLRRLRRTQLVLGGSLALLVLVATGAYLAARRRDAVAAAATIERPPPATPGSVPAGPATPVARARSALVVDAPPEARVTVNNFAVGSGPWRADTLASGRYEVVASVIGGTDCPASREKASAILLDTGVVTVKLAPRACGLVVIEARPPGEATFTVTNGTGVPVLDGRLPLASPVVLPAGDYRLRVERRFCAPYEQGLRIAAGRTPLAVRFSLLCEKR